MFTQEQLSTSLRTSSLILPALRSAIIMDIEQLHNDIRQSLLLDPLSSMHLPTPTLPNWSLDDNGLLCYYNRIYVPDFNTTHLHVLQYKHDHILSGHFGQTKTLELVRQEYVWPNMRTFIQDFCKSCTTCKHSKAPCHKPYGLLKQLPIPEKPWNSISMDFIEHLPKSSKYSAILVIVN